MKVVAVKKVSYGKGRYQPGDKFEAEKRYAVVLIGTGHIREETDEFGVSVNAPRRRKRYKRADMVAEGSQP